MPQAPRRHRPLIAATFALVAACAHSSLQSTTWVEDAMLDEISGIAASQVHHGVLWALEDNANPAELVALDASGQRRATLHIAGADNLDWEDLARFDWQGRPHLLIADVGDNDAKRARVRLLAIAEPETLVDATVTPVWDRELVWSDGPRDSEAVVVDAARGEILLVTKRTLPPRLYVAALPPSPSDDAGTAEEPLRAEFVVALAGVPVTPIEDVRADYRAAWRHQPTAASLSPDGRRLAVLTYVEVLIYTRNGDEDWAAAVSRPPQILPLPTMRQAEAISWTVNGGSLLVTGEKLPTPIHRLPLPVD